MMLVPMMSTEGIQVGRELNAVEVEVEGLGQRADQQSLAQAGDAFGEGV